MAAMLVGIDDDLMTPPLFAILPGSLRDSAPSRPTHDA
jgi:hypothetical protein